MNDMILKKSRTVAGFLVLITTVLNGAAQHNIPPQRPVVQTSYTADPAPMVYNDTVFLYTGHDEDDAMGFKMHNWLLYSSTDMVNWTEHGAVASLKNFEWVPYDNGAWAAQCIERNGKFYLYCPMPGGVGIGVLFADNPYGPFREVQSVSGVHDVYFVFKGERDLFNFDW